MSVEAAERHRIVLGWILLVDDAATGLPQGKVTNAFCRKPRRSFTTFHGVSPYDDMFRAPSGSTFNTQATFYEGLSLPNQFKPGISNATTMPAGILRATPKNPHLPLDHATRANRRWWVAP